MIGIIFEGLLFFFDDYKFGIKDIMIFFIIFGIYFFWEFFFVGLY